MPQRSGADDHEEFTVLADCEPFVIKNTPLPEARSGGTAFGVHT